MAKFTCNFISYTLHRTVDVTVVVPTVTIPGSLGMADGTPPRHTPKAKYPVVYTLHGYGNNHANWTGYTNVEMFAEERQIVIVNISAENKSYVKIGGEDFFAFVSEELPDFVCGMFPVSDKPEDTYIAGLSMGGFGALVHGLNHPERFKAIGLLSPAVQVDPERMAAGDAFGSLESESADPRFRPGELAEKLAAEGKKFPKIYMACGDKDFLIEADKAFRDKLISLGADVTWSGSPDYGHEWRFWNLEIEKFLDWLPRTDVYAKEGRRQI